MPGKLFLIPNSLGSADPDTFLPANIKSQIVGLKYLIVENIRNARRYLKSINKDVDINEIIFYELNKHTNPIEIETYLEPVLAGNNMGIISEAGLPGIADPGAVVVSLAHKKNIRVIPFVGPSSIFMALMASGLNGQSFRFAGYLPVNSKERIQAIKQLELKSFKEDETQIFIETPYRNNALIDAVLLNCNPNTKFTIAADISTESEMIQTLTVAEWRKNKPELHKHPVVYLIGK